METFYLTFGQRYAREPHPRWSPAHPDGWVTIQAPTYDDARTFVVRTFGTAWCELYSDVDFDRTYFPLGELAGFAVDRSLSADVDPSPMYSPLGGE